MTPSPDVTIASGGLDLVVNAIASLLLIAAVFAVMILVGTYQEKKAGRGLRLQAQLGFEGGSADLWHSVDAFPMNVDGGVCDDPEFSAWGDWRGRRAESVLLVPVGDGMMLAKFRAEFVEIDADLPRVEFLRRHRQSFVPTGGGNVIDVESEQFNKRFDVICADLAYAHAVLQPRMIERLLCPDAKYVSVTIVGSRVFCWFSSSDGSPNAAKRLDLLSDVADLLPSFLGAKFGRTGRASKPPVVSPDADASADAPPEFTPDPAFGDGGTLAPRLVAPWHPASLRAQRPAVRRTASDGTRNWLAVLGWVFLATIVLWPAGIAMGHLALRAERAGHADNAVSARRLLYVGYGMPPLALLLVSWWSSSSYIHIP